MTSFTFHMPKGFRSGPGVGGAGQAPSETVSVRVGGGGGAGQAPSFSSKSFSIDIPSTRRLPKLKTSSFCDQYHLGPEIRALLEKNEFVTINSFLRVEETALKALNFKVGHIAELRWAVKKMLVDNGIPTANIPQGDTYTSIRGGTGGTGGDGLQRGGIGGTGKAPQMGMADLFRLGWIGGGIGGAGGAGGPSTGVVSTTYFAGSREMNLDVDGGTASRRPDFFGVSTLFVRHVLQLSVGGYGRMGGWGADQGGVGGVDGGTARKRPDLFGGYGGTGGWGADQGGVGGVGEATELSVTDLAFFRQISGGFGGTGGASDIEGGMGGTGEAPTLTSPLVDPIDDETRRRLPHRKLDDLDFDSPSLCQLLKDLGFESAGGLLELNEADIPPQSKLKVGQRGELKYILEDFILEFDE